MLQMGFASSGAHSTKEAQRHWECCRTIVALLICLCFQFWMFSDTRDIPDDCRNRGNSRNVNPSSGCQMNEADRPVKRLRRKRRLLLESEDDEENADEDEVNKAACVFFKENCEKLGQLSQVSMCNAS